MIKKKRLVLSLVAVSLLSLLLTTVASAEAVKDGRVFHMHTDDYRDADNFYNLLDGKDYEAYKYYGSSCVGSYFCADDRTVMYWSAHGNDDGDMWGENSLNGPETINIYGIDDDWNDNYTEGYVSNSYWNADLEFVYISACYQLEANVRWKYARGMLGTQRVRVVCGYFSTAPSYSTGDYEIVEKFGEYAEAAQSVKYSWIQAHEWYYGLHQYTSSRNYCVLTHAGSVQYSRMPGFGGTQYTRPSTSVNDILRFSHVNPNGIEQPTDPPSYKASLYSSAVEENGLLLNCEPEVPDVIPSYSLITIKTDLSASTNMKESLIQTNENEATYSIHELGDKEMLASKDEVIKTANNFAACFKQGKDKFAANLEEISPLVSAKVNLDGDVDQEKEYVFAYSILYSNRFDGLKIKDNFFLTLIDSDGVSSCMLKWSDFNKTSYKGIYEKPLSFIEAVSVLSEHIVKDSDFTILNTTTTRKTSEMNANDVNNYKMINSAELVFSSDVINDGMYHPTWVFSMADGTQAQIDCYNGDVIIAK